MSPRTSRRRLAEAPCLPCVPWASPACQTKRASLRRGAPRGGQGPVCLPHLSCSEVDSDGAALARARLVAGTAGQCCSLAVALWAAQPSCSLTKRRPSVLSSDRVSVYTCEALGLKSAARATGEAKCAAGALGWPVWPRRLGVPGGPWGPWLLLKGRGLQDEVAGREGGSWEPAGT